MYVSVYVDMSLIVFICKSFHVDTYTSGGKKIALVEVLNHDMKFASDRFFVSFWRGRWGTVKL